MSRDFVEATHIAFCKEPGKVDMCVWRLMINYRRMCCVISCRCDSNFCCQVNELNNVLSHFISRDKCRLTQKL